MLGDYNHHSFSDPSRVSHYKIGSFGGTRHWKYSHYEIQTFVPQEEGITEHIRSDPNETIAELNAKDLDGIAFYGPSGAGKTVVAVKLMQRYRWHAYDIFWADASTPATLAKDFQHISGLLKNSASTHTNFFNRVCGDRLPLAKSADKRLPISEDPISKTTAMKNTDNTTANDTSSYESLLSVVKSELEFPSRPNWLLVLDNLTDETVITGFLPKSPNGMIIVTTRSLHLASGLGCQTVEMPRMSPTNAMLLFKINYRNPGESEVKQDEAMELMELLEHFPARIVDAALHMSENRVLAREYLAELKAARRLAEKRSRPWRLFGLGGIYGCWNGAVAAGCFVVFSVLLAWAIGFRRG
ncbi:P-loop containing nucleoside triphosphate hydrolase protein [Tuber indicum]|nr:P-loop containing nucleoside triphosphate hydrolase protein [Tuber indicum]